LCQRRSTPCCTTAATTFLLRLTPPLSLHFPSPNPRPGSVASRTHRHHLRCRTAGCWGRAQLRFCGQLLLAYGAHRLPHLRCCQTAVSVVYLKAGQSLHLRVGAVVAESSSFADATLLSPPFRRHLSILRRSSPASELERVAVGPGRLCCHGGFGFAPTCDGHVSGYPGLLRPARWMRATLAQVGHDNL
jgi:hypothetical protein